MSCKLKMQLFTIVWTICVIKVCGCGVDSAPYHTSCETDHECPASYYCVPISNLCAKCVECNVYKRKSSWRSCPKDPADCGACLAGFEEEILAGGRTRDICVKSSVIEAYESSTERIRRAGSGIMREHFMLILGMSLVLLPTLFYVYFRKYWRQDDSRLQNSSSMPCEEPPPYHSSLELAPLRSTPREEEVCLSETNHVLNVHQKEETLVQAVPFRLPQYEQNLSFVANEEDQGRIESESESDEGNDHETNLQLEDESTMPSEWSPTEEEINNELISAETCVSSELVPEIDVNSEPCEPRNKRLKKEEDSDGPDNNRQRPINLIINNNNNITINKFV
uniref:TNFR-Cys domain-containing protein n=2 Tax=Clastoptera arizonana TaxID=38151 RepID=A0A1B6ED10_9HEMI